MVIFGKRHTDLDDVIRHALDQGLDVGIEDSDDYGYELIIDGVPVQRLTPEQFGHRIERQLEGGGVEDLVHSLEEKFVSKHKEAIEASESSPWFVKQLRMNGLYLRQVVKWVDLDSAEEVEAAITKAELQEDPSERGGIL